MKEPALDSVLHELLVLLGRQRFAIYQFNRTRHGPELLGAVHDWGEVADVLILMDERSACAYRTPKVDANGRKVDIFAVKTVYWSTTSNPAWTILRLLELPQPAHPDAPRDVTLAPTDIYQIPKDARQKTLLQTPPRHRR